MTVPQLSCVTIGSLYLELPAPLVNKELSDVQNTLQYYQNSVPAMCVKFREGPIVLNSSGMYTGIFGN
jgi:hypothetical protein